MVPSWATKNTLRPVTGSTTALGLVMLVVSPPGRGRDARVRPDAVCPITLCSGRSLAPAAARPAAVSRMVVTPLNSNTVTTGWPFATTVLVRGVPPPASTSSTSSASYVVLARNPSGVNAFGLRNREARMRKDRLQLGGPVAPTHQNMMPSRASGSANPPDWLSVAGPPLWRRSPPLSGFHLVPSPPPRQNGIRRC